MAEIMQRFYECIEPRSPENPRKRIDATHEECPKEVTPFETKGGTVQWVCDCQCHLGKVSDG